MDIEFLISCFLLYLYFLNLFIIDQYQRILIPLKFLIPLIIFYIFHVIRKNRINNEERNLILPKIIKFLDDHYDNFHKNKIIFNNCYFYENSLIENFLNEIDNLSKDNLFKDSKLYSYFKERSNHELERLRKAYKIGKKHSCNLSFDFNFLKDLILDMKEYSENFEKNKTTIINFFPTIYLTKDNKIIDMYELERINS